MFDNIGRSLDEEATKRSFASLLITSLLAGAGAAFMVGWATVQVIDTLQTSPPILGPIVLFEPPDEIPQESAPPPPLLRGVVLPVPVVPTPVQPDELQSEPAELEPVSDKLQQPAGDPDGSDLGSPDGAKHGVPHSTGTTGGGNGTGGGGARRVHHLDVTPKRRVHPLYPKDFVGAGLGEQRCRVHVSIDRKGVPQAVKAELCPEAFQLAAVAALSRWRWYAPKVNGERAAVQTTILVRFKE